MFENLTDLTCIILCSILRLNEKKWYLKVVKKLNALLNNNVHLSATQQYVSPVGVWFPSGKS